MNDKIKINNICERDLDLFLQEEFISSDEFCVWFAVKAGLNNAISAASPAKRGKTDRTGETDITVELNTGQMLPTVLLIENKITAQFQPNQADRYREKGEKFVSKNMVADFRTVLVSPANYFAGDLKGFDASFIGGD